MEIDNWLLGKKAEFLIADTYPHQIRCGAEFKVNQDQCWARIVCKTSSEFFASPPVFEIGWALVNGSYSERYLTILETDHEKQKEIIKNGAIQLVHQGLGPRKYLKDNQGDIRFVLLVNPSAEKKIELPISNPLKNSRLPEFTFKDLPTNPSYTTLLKCREWFLFRWKVLGRDNWQCLQCGVKHTQIDVAGLPITWEYGFVGDRKTIDFINGQNIHPVVDGILSSNGKFLQFGDQISNYGLPWAIGASREVILQCHHKYHVNGNLPWEYPLEAMSTLCEGCHKKRHGL